LDLADLTTIKVCAEEFLSKETRLHVLFNNAGVMAPAAGLPKTPQGYELHLGTNNIGTFMFTKLLTPILATTAKTAPSNTVRVVWVSSSGAEIGSHRPGGVPLDYKKSQPSAIIRYAISKAGNYLHAVEYARRFKEDGIVSVSLNPGNLDSELYRDQGALFGFFIRHTVLYPSIYGAYTEMWAGLCPDVALERSGEWGTQYFLSKSRSVRYEKLTTLVAPWGRFMKIRPDLLEASKDVDEGGSGIAKKFWEWTEEQIKPYL
jgi:retinol dehydrogenase-12